jgi:hypothetical protein
MRHLLPAESFAILLTDEHTGRILRRKSGLSAKTAATIIKLVDGAAEIGGKVAEVVNASRTLERVVTDSVEVISRAFAPLLEQSKPRKIAARRKR